MEWNGSSWNPLATDDQGLGVHADIHALVFNANNQLLVGTDGGIYREDSDPYNSSGFLWTDLNANLNTIQFYSISVNPSNGNVLGGNQDNGVALYNASNGQWTQTDALAYYNASSGTWGETDGGDGGMVFVSGTLAYHASPVTSYGKTAFFRVSNDGGQTWLSATSGLNGNDPMDFIAPFTVDPSNKDRVVFGSNQIYQTTNAASSWTKLTSTGVNGWNPKANNVDTIGLAASDAKTIYASTGSTGATSSQIFVSTDGGTTWAERDLPSGSGRVNQIIVDPSNALIAYAVVNQFTSGAGHVWKTADGGKHWTDISGNLPNLPTWSVQLDAANNILYVGNDQGVYSSTNGGQSWAPVGTGLPNAQVFSLVYDPTLNLLAAGTHGRGTWELSTTTPIVITTNPTDQTVTAGQTATFTAAASGNPTPTVQWQYSSNSGMTWNTINGATTTTLSVPNVSAAMNGYEYEAVFNNSIGTATTSDATLTVQYPPTVTTSPSSQTVTPGQTATFTAAASGNPLPAVQWQVSIDNGNSFSNISGATSSTLTLNNVTTTMSGYEYRAVFTNSAGSAITSAATLTVTPVPTPPVVTLNPSSQTVSAGQTATFTAAASGNPTPTVQWQVSIDNGNSFSNISGATSSTLTLNNVTTTMSGYEYRAIFTNSAGSATTSAASLTVQYPPTVTTNPSNETVTAGQTATFTAAASGNPTPSVQWQLSIDNGNSFSSISGATSSTLTLNNVTTTMSGYEYRAVFTNSAGRATTNPATLTVTTVLTLPVVTLNPSSQTVPAGQTASFTAAASGNPTPTVQWQVSTDGGNTFSNISGATSTTLTVSNVAWTQDGFKYRAVFTNSVGNATTNIAMLTVLYAPFVVVSPTNQTVNAGQNVSFTAAASGNPTPTVQWQVSTDGGNTFSNISGATSNALSLINVQISQSGNQYRAVFTNTQGVATTNPATLTVTPVPTPPVITLDPSSQTVTVGQIATFTAAASGNPTPTVQWQSSGDGGTTWKNVDGATSTTLTLAPAQATWNGQEFRAVFSNSAGSVITKAATLTVQYAPTVTTDPINETVTAGQTATFTAAASGNPTPTVQWQYSSNSGMTWNTINGATTTTLSVPNVSAAMNGYEYEAVFTNNAGSATTNAATLTVWTVPVITSGNSATFTVGQAGSFTVTATGVPTPSFTVSGALPSGVTFTNNGNGTATLAGTPGTGTQGTYYFTITAHNSAGDATQNFVLTVYPAPVTPPTTTTPSQPPVLHVPSLLAYFNGLLGGIETINANGTETVTDSIFGFALLVSNFDSSGNLMSVSLFGIDVTWVFKLL